LSNRMKKVSKLLVKDLKDQLTKLDIEFQKNDKKAKLLSLLTDHFAEIGVDIQTFDFDNEIPRVKPVDDSGPDTSLVEDVATIEKLDPIENLEIVEIETGDSNNAETSDQPPACVAILPNVEENTQTLMDGPEIANQEKTANIENGHTKIEEEVQGKVDEQSLRNVVELEISKTNLASSDEAISKSKSEDVVAEPQIQKETLDDPKDTEETVSNTNNEVIELDTPEVETSEAEKVEDDKAEIISEKEVEMDKPETEVLTDSPAVSVDKNVDIIVEQQLPPNSEDPKDIYLSSMSISVEEVANTVPEDHTDGAEKIESVKVEDEIVYVEKEVVMGPPEAGDLTDSPAGPSAENFDIVTKEKMRPKSETQVKPNQQNSGSSEQVAFSVAEAMFKDDKKRNSINKRQKKTKFQSLLKRLLKKRNVFK